MTVSGDYIHKINKNTSQVVDSFREDNLLPCIVVSIIITLTILFLWFSVAFAQVFSPAYYEKIADAIFKIEGGYKANQLFGINPKYVKCNGYDDCRRVCINTIKNKEVEWLDSEEEDFLVYLSKRYCPPNHEVWFANLKYYLNRG